jgi:hypothetical protein
MFIGDIPKLVLVYPVIPSLNCKNDDANLFQVSIIYPQIPDVFTIFDIFDDIIRVETVNRAIELFI